MHDTPFRWALGAILGLAIIISGYHRWRARAISGTIARRQEDAGLIALRLAFGVPLLLTLLAFLVRPSLLGWSRMPLSLPLRWLGVAVGVVCIPLVFWVVRSLGSNISETVLTKAEHELVVHGPYRWVRHPLYITGLLLLASAALMTSNWLIGGLTAMTLLVIRFVVIPREEAALLARFGDRYRAYMVRTGALLPRRRS